MMLKGRGRQEFLPKEINKSELQWVKEGPGFSEGSV